MKIDGSIKLLELYRQYKNTAIQESYCKVSLKRGQRSVLAKIRLGVFPHQSRIRA